MPTAERPYKDFQRFHAESVNVSANGWVVDLARDFDARGVDVVVVTARRAMWRNQTAMWLALNGVPSVALCMRHSKDGRSDVEVKRDILTSIRRSWTVVGAVDDNPKICALWESEGIPVTVVPGWETN